MGGCGRPAGRQGGDNELHHAAPLAGGHVRRREGAQRGSALRASGHRQNVAGEGGGYGVQSALPQRERARAPVHVHRPGFFESMFVCPFPVQAKRGQR